MQGFWFRIREWFADRFYQAPGENQRWIDLSTGSTSSSTALVNSIGYIMLLFAALEFANFLWPLRLTDPQWELDTFGKLVDNIWGPLIGFGFVFYRTAGVSIRKLELRFLALLTWLVLAIGILYVLLIPLTTLNAWRLDRLTTRNYEAARAQTQEQLSNIRDAVESGTIPPQRLQTLGASLQLPRDSEIPIEQQILGAVEQRQSQTLANFTQQRTTWRKGIVRRVIKWNLGAILIGFIFSWMWFLTRSLREALRNSQ